MAVRDILERIEQYTVSIINGRRETACDRAYRIFLFTLSHIYRFAVDIRLSMYKHSILKRINLGSFVVSVGNLTVGGTGKTPVVELLARTLAERGRKVAILSRGYRSKPRTWKEKLADARAKVARLEAEDIERGLGHYSWSKRAIKTVMAMRERMDPRVVSDGHNIMLARNLLDEPGRLGVAVVVDKDRVHGGRFAITHFGADTLLLDDGFQYMPLRPRINIVLVDSTNPFHNHQTLPGGLLREPIEHVKQADYIFLTKSKGSASLRHLKAFLRRHNTRSPIIECNHEPCHLQCLWSAEKMALSALAGKKVAAICGIAVPESFENYLRALGGTIVYHECYVDHHRYRESEIESFCKKAVDHGAEMFVTTEKDSVRIPKVNTDGLPFMFLRVEIRILKGASHFDDCIRNICMR
ncbi:MAG: tetraacyldisaccharide 4'-kinase [Victivallales bacterium]|nr:tetraacyldisaccharide 4'-kinase [Victivallales bacterium]